MVHVVLLHLLAVSWWCCVCGSIGAGGPHLGGVGGYGGSGECVRWSDCHRGTSVRLYIVVAGNKRRANRAADWRDH